MNLQIIHFKGDMFCKGGCFRELNYFVLFLFTLIKMFAFAQKHNGLVNMTDTSEFLHDSLFYFVKSLWELQAGDQ